MKKSELRKIIREVISEQMSTGIQPPRPLKGRKNFPGSPGGFDPFGGDIEPGSGNNSANMSGEGMEMQLYQAMGRPRTLNAIGVELKRTGLYPVQQVDNLLRNLMRQYGLGPNDPLMENVNRNKNLLNEGLLKVFGEILKWGSGFLVGYYFGS